MHQGCQGIIRVGSRSLEALFVCHRQLDLTEVFKQSSIPFKRSRHIIWIVYPFLAFHARPLSVSLALQPIWHTHNARHGFAQWTASKYHWRNSSPFSTGMGAHVLLVMIIRPNMPSHMPKRSSAGFVHEGSLALPHGPLCFWYLSSKFDHVHWKEAPMGPKVRSADFAGSNSQILTSERSNYCSG